MADGLGDPAMETGLFPHQRFGSYELLEEIGRGGMGVIYRARQAGLERVVALKMLLAGEFADAKARVRLLREARVAAGLSHPNLVSIHEAGEHQGRVYFTMEYVPGPNLSQLCRDGPLAVAVALGHTIQLARVVQFAHEHGVIHRDLKPANVLLAPGGVVKLTDFGLTRSLAADVPSLTMGSAGTPNFMAPEQADPQLGDTGTHTDIYGLGALLYYLLTGRAPVDGSNLGAIIRAVVEVAPKPLRELRPEVSADLEAVCFQCLEKVPGRRYRTAGEVADELERVQQNRMTEARRARALRRAWIRRHWRGWLRTGAGIAGMAGLGLVGWMLWQGAAGPTARSTPDANHAAAPVARRFPRAPLPAVLNQAADDWLEQFPALELDPTPRVLDASLPPHAGLPSRWSAELGSWERSGWLSKAVFDPTNSFRVSLRFQTVADDSGGLTNSFVELWLIDALNQKKYYRVGLGAGGTADWRPLIVANTIEPEWREFQAEATPGVWRRMTISGGPMFYLNTQLLRDADSGIMMGCSHRNLSSVFPEGFRIGVTLARGEVTGRRRLHVVLDAVRVEGL